MGASVLAMWIVRHGACISHSGSFAKRASTGVSGRVTARVTRVRTPHGAPIKDGHLSALSVERNG